MEKGEAAGSWISSIIRTDRTALPRDKAVIADIAELVWLVANISRDVEMVEPPYGASLSVTRPCAVEKICTVLTTHFGRDGKIGVSKERVFL